MDEMHKSCPFCGAQMVRRLGALECVSCGHTEEPQQPVAKPAAEPEYAGPGFQRPWSRPGEAPATPPPGALYSPGMAPAHGLYDGPEKPKSASLETEKKVYFGIQVSCSVLYVLLIIIAAIATGDGTSFFMVLGALIGTVIGIAILNWVLFEGELWGKWTCLGCSGLGLLMSFFSMLSMSNKSMWMQMGVPLEVFTWIGFMWIGFLLQIAWSGWFMSILWRDIQANKV